MLTAAASEIAKVLNVTARSIQRRAIKENWPFETENGRGVPTKKFIVAKLPLEIALLINKDEIQKFQTENALVCQPGALVVRAPGQSPESRAWPAPTKALAVKKWDTPINSVQMSLAMEKASILHAYQKQVDAAPFGDKIKVREQFINAYNSGIPWPDAFEKIGPLSWKTIEGWKTKAKTYGGDTLCLADRRGYVKRGEITVTQEQGDIFLKCALNQNKLKVSEAIRMARAVMAQAGVKNGHSDSTYRRFLSEYKKRHFDVYTALRDGDKALNDDVAYTIIRDYDKIQVGDELVGDGHDLNFEIISPWTGKPKRMKLVAWFDMKASMPVGWEIVDTENTEAIASAFRRAVIHLGKYPKLAYIDNGRAFKSEYMSAMFKRVGTELIVAKPYHGQSKTIERFFGTMGEFERWMPTYCGNNIQNQPARMNRGEKRHRKIYEKVMGDRCVTWEQANAALQFWIEQYAVRPQRGHLEGTCPADVFEQGRGPGVDPAELNFLMMAQEIRHIRKTGITLPFGIFYHPELYGLRTAVLVRYDLHDPSYILVFDLETGQLICKAEPQDKVHPAAAKLGTDEDQKRLADQMELKNSLIKQTWGTAKELMETQILPESKRQFEQLGLTSITLPIPSNKRENPVRRLEIAPKSEPLPTPEEMAAKIAEMKAWEAENDAKTMWIRLGSTPEAQRYEQLIDIEAQGLLIPKEHQNFMTYFESKPGYAREKDYYDELRVKAIVKWQKEESEVRRQNENN